MFSSRAQFQNTGAPKASLRREAPKGGGWGRGWIGRPPPAGGGPGVSPVKYLENCFKMVYSGRIWGVSDAHFTTGNLYEKICVSKLYPRIWRANFLEMLVFSLLRNFI